MCADVRKNGEKDGTATEECVKRNAGLPAVSQRQCHHCHLDGGGGGGCILATAGHRRDPLARYLLMYLVGADSQNCAR